MRHTGPPGYRAHVVAVEIVGVRVEIPSNQPVLLLREFNGARYLPIWIGASEATAIAMAQQGIEPPRPLTHDLIKELLDTFGITLLHVEIPKLDDGVFYASLIFSNGDEVSCRPSDAVALALRTGADVGVAEEVLQAAGIELAEDNETEVEAFREFLDKVAPEDFELH